MTRSVLAVPTGDDYTAPAIYVGTANTIEEAIALLEAEGYTVIHDGGNIDQYDAEDSANLFGETAHGLPSISITVEDKPEAGR